MTFNLFVCQAVSFFQLSPPNILCAFLFTPIHAICWIAILSLILSVEYRLMNKNNGTFIHVVVSRPLLLCPSQTHTHISLTTLFSNSLTRCPSLPPVHYWLIFVFSFRETAGAHWCSGKMMAIILKWELCLLAIYTAVKRVTQRSSLESPVTWIGFRQTLTLWFPQTPVNLTACPGL
jgi:hypothetical protein